MAIEYHRDGPWNLPEGWVWARLGDLCDFVGRGRGPSYVEKGGVTVVNQKCVRWRKFEDRFLRQTARAAFERLPRHLRLQSGDVLWNSTGTGTIGRAVVYDGHLGEVTADSHITIVRPRLIESYFVCLYIETMRVQHLVTDENVGSTNQQELPRSFVQELLIPVPPAAEQRRIVARVDELFTDIADGETALARARDDLDTWRRALLKAVVTGELTREWRESNRSNATGSDVVAAATELKAQFGVRSNRRRHVDEDDVDFDSVPQIPMGWTWAKLSDFAHASSYGTSVKCSRDSSGIPVLRIPNIRSGRIDLSDIKCATTVLDLSDDEFLDIGDLLVVRTNGSEDLIGRAAMVGEPLPDRCYFASYLIRFRIVANAELRRWIALYFESPIARAWVRKNIASSAGQYNISQTALMRMPIPIPPELEMIAGLRLFREIDGVRDDVAIDAQAAGQASPALRQSILRAAFEGRLAEQDPRDEPADRLLARLSELREALPPASRPRRRRAAIAAE